MALEIRILDIKLYEGSKLVVSQLLKHYDMNKVDLLPYFYYATQLIEKFNSISLEHVPRKENRMADGLASLATTIALSNDERITIAICCKWIIPSLYFIEESIAISISESNHNDWREPLINY